MFTRTTALLLVGAFFGQAMAKVDNIVHAGNCPGCHAKTLACGCKLAANYICGALDCVASSSSQSKVATPIKPRVAVFALRVLHVPWLSGGCHPHYFQASVPSVRVVSLQAMHIRLQI